MGNKKGLSSVVATISLVLLSFVAVAIISSYVIPLVRESLEDSTECRTYSEYFVFNEEFGYNCYAIEGNNRLYALSIGAKGIDKDKEDKVEGVVISFVDSSGESSSVELIPGSTDWGSEVGKIRRVNISLPLEIPESGGTRTYVYNSSKVFDYVYLAPKLKSGRLCEQSDSIKISGEECRAGKGVTVG